MAQKTVRAKNCYTSKENGLTKPWLGRVWLNPPYAAGLVDAFVAKLLEEIDAGRVTQAIVLTDESHRHCVVPQLGGRVLAGVLHVRPDQRLQQGNRQQQPSRWVGIILLR